MFLYQAFLLNVQCAVYLNTLEDINFKTDQISMKLFYIYLYFNFEHNDIALMDLTQQVRFYTTVFK